MTDVSLSGRQHIVLSSKVDEVHVGAIVAHEAAHLAQNHDRFNVAWSFFEVTCLAAVAAWVVRALARHHGVPPRPAQLWPTLLLVRLSMNLVLGLGENVLNRQNEIAADIAASDVVGADALIAELRTMMDWDEPYPTPGQSWWNDLAFSHPNNAARIEAVLQHHAISRD